MERENDAYNKVKIAIIHPKNTEIHIPTLEKLVKIFSTNYIDIDPDKVDEISKLWEIQRLNILSNE